MATLEEGEVLMTKKVSARQKAMQAQAVLLAERDEQDKRVVAAATQWFAAIEKVESLQSEIDSHRDVMAQSVVALCSEGMTVSDVATMFEVDQRTVSEMRKRGSSSGARNASAASAPSLAGQPAADQDDGTDEAGAA